MERPATPSSDIIGKLRAHKEDLRGRGVQHAVVFGSLARGDGTDRSDIDLAVTLAADARLTLFDLVGLESYITRLVGRKVDLVKLPVSRNDLRAAIERDGNDAL